jgi:GntR family transcriptional regulator, sialic acid-inducible nan operon repressor
VAKASGTLPDVEYPAVQRRRLSDAVFEHLLGGIKDGSFSPGDALPSERTLMKSVGVGRPAVRQALQALERMGLIQIRHGERARVSEPSFGLMIEGMGETMHHLLVHSPASLEHLKEARATFEREMARIAARKRTDGDIARLRETVADQEAAMSDPARFRMLDGRFHRDVAGISGNPIWPAVSEALFGWLSQFHVDLVAVPGLERLTLDEHRQILDAIERRVPDAAGQAMADHLNRANDLYRRAHLGRD